MERVRKSNGNSFGAANGSSYGNIRNGGEGKDIREPRILFPLQIQDRM